MLVDLHAQSMRVGGRGADPAKVIEAARKVGLDGVAFVERLQSSQAGELLAAGKAADFPVFVGVEIPAALGRFLCFAPEVDPFFTREEWRQLMALPMAPTAARIVQLFDELGGAVLASQPYERENGARLGDSLVFCDGLAGVEALTPAHSRVECMLAVELGIKMGLPLVGGSAGQEIGRFATLFSSELRTQAELVSALRSGNFWAVQLGDAEARRAGPSGRSRRRTSSGGGEETGGGPRGSRRRQGGRGRPGGGGGGGRGGRGGDGGGGGRGGRGRSEG
jgi:hypothetical protein